MAKKLMFSVCGLIVFLGFSSIAAAQALKSDLMFCGSSQRTAANLYLGVGPFTEVSGCVPDGNTQALLVTRYGSVGGHGAAWLAYLNAGGVIITEYNIAASVYNEIYGTAYSKGSGFGDCRDNAMPSLKLNPGHPFWLDNSGLTETPADQEGCGYDLAGLVNAEPLVTALGGLSGTPLVSFAIRPQGDGVLWLLEADWQDSESYYTDTSRYFMGALISGGTYGTGLQEAVPVPTLSGIGLLLLALALAFVAVRRRILV